ncbi:MAG: DUF1802 family protein [Gammaproteobacteria bacterium]|nr:MAG: DUF1802 family protein [Gammaproteobacteria bacterium]
MVTHVIDVALKEWAVVCDLMLSGDLCLLLRKGGIHESGGPGVFELEYPRFVLYPSFEHQRAEMLKPIYQDRIDPIYAKSDSIDLRAVGEAVKVWQVPSRWAFDQLDDMHCWSAAQIDMRFKYKPERPLYLIAVRVFRLAKSRRIIQRPEYVGCRSWINLHPEDVVDDAGSVPVLTDPTFQSVVARVDQVFSESI